MKEEAAKQKICPLMSKGTTPNTAVPAGECVVNCRGSECMFWVWYSDKSGGYCKQGA